MSFHLSSKTIFTKFHTVLETRSLIDCHSDSPILGAYCVPGTVLTIRDITVNKADIVSTLQNKSSSLCQSLRSYVFFFLYQIKFLSMLLVWSILVSNISNTVLHCIWCVLGCSHSENNFLLTIIKYYDIFICSYYLKRNKKLCVWCTCLALRKKMSLVKE